MLKAMRENTKIVLWIVTIGFLAMIVIEWGIGGFSGVVGPSRGVIGKINGQDIPLTSYSQILDQNFQSKRTELNLDNLDEATRDQVTQQTWNTIINEFLINQELANLNIIISDEEIARYIQNNPPAYIQSAPVFQNDDNEFDQQKYKEFLASPQSYANPQNKQFIVGMELETKNFLQRQELFLNLVSTARVTDQEVRNAYLNKNEQIRIQYVAITPYDIADSLVKITSDEKLTYYKNNQDEFKLEEQRVVVYVQVDKQMTQNDSAMAKKEIERINGLLKNGESFEEMARAYSEDPSASNGGRLGFFGRGSMEPPFEETAFGLDSGQVSQPVMTRFGWHLIQGAGSREENENREVAANHILIKFKISHKTLSDRKTKLENFRQKALEPNADFKNAASDFELKVSESSPFPKDSYISGIGYAKSLVNYFFSNPVGTIGEMYETNWGFVVAKLTKVNQAGIQPIADAEVILENKMKKIKKLERAKAKISTIQQKLSNAEAWTQMKQSDNPEVEIHETSSPVTREDYLPYIGSKNKVIASAFNLETPGTISNIIATERGYILVRLLEKFNVDESDYEIQKVNLKNSLRQEKQNKMYTAWFSELRKTAEIEDFRDLYYQ